MATKQIPWHALGLNETKERLLADFNRGLDEKEVLKRQKHYGKNTFERRKRFYYLKLLWKQVKSPLVFILIIAGVITFFLKEYTNTIVIFIVVFINTAIGIFQEGKASQSLNKLKSSQKKYATVMRSGQRKIIESSDIVPGDIIILQMGDQVPADARLIEEKGLEVNESILTGEWVAVAKDTKKKIADAAHITKKENMAWMGTLITEGWARAVAVNIGFNTEIGKIAEAVSGEDNIVTPLQKGIKKLARFLGIIIISALVVIFAFGIIRGETFTDMLLISVAIAVAAIPSGLPIAVTVVLAIGMGRILAQKGLIKNLNAAETLGSTSVILTDKTGTLTKAEMMVSKIMTLISESEKFKKREHKDRLQVLQMALNVSGAFIENPNDDLKDWIIRGNPTDRAIFIASIESGLQPLDIIKKNRRIDFIPFDSERRFAASMHSIEKNKTRIYMIGAPELILSFCNKIYQNETEVKLTEKEAVFLRHCYEKETSSGTRIIGVAYRDGKWDSFPHHGESDGIFNDMIFGGFIGFHDPLRADVLMAMENAKNAMVRPVMITGDHLITARKIAEEVGILSKDGIILEGDDIEKMDDKKLEDVIEKVDVFARVLPHQKMRITEAWQKKGAVVAMTGDGVNDAPALKRADIGIALGSATEVAKEASDMILLNDSFSIIVATIEEGRRILDNLKKIIAYLLSTAFSEIILVGVAIVAGMPLPVLPAQILWINIIEEGFMNFAFAFEPKEKDLMKRDPRNQSAKNILTKNMKKLILIITTVTGILLLGLFLALFYLEYPIEKIRTIMFASLSIDSIFFAFSLKNLRKPVWKINIFSNHYLIFSLLVSIFLLGGALFIPALRQLFSIVPLSGNELLFILGIGIFNLLTIETAKYFSFKKNKKL
ncbi:HAD-IC family P-type ATPase [Patescibacteria group bacterium]|nr:HAD-IC family P-type ATPase [Patescibacteria group bacterium]